MRTRFCFFLRSIFQLPRVLYHINFHLSSIFQKKFVFLHFRSFEQILGQNIGDFTIFTNRKKCATIYSLKVNCSKKLQSYEDKIPRVCFKTIGPFWVVGLRVIIRRLFILYFTSFCGNTIDFFKNMCYNSYRY